MYDLVVIGAGSGGLSLAKSAARVGAKVALIEKNRLGGESSLGAALPSKGLVQAANLARQMHNAARFGLRTGPVQVDWDGVRGHVQDVAIAFAHAETADSLRELGIDVFEGSAAFSAYDTVTVNGTTLVPGHRFVIATGSRPAIPEIPGLSDAMCLDCQSIWSIKALPQSLIVIGSEPAGLEIAQCFARFGSNVTLLSNATTVLPLEDPEASELVARTLTAEGVTIKTGVEITKVEMRGEDRTCIFRDITAGAAGEASASAILIAAGRLANVEHLNLEAAGVHGDPLHGIHVDEYLQTDSTRVQAIGDVLLKHSYVQFAEAEAAAAFHNSVLRLKKKVDYSAIPRGTFTDPEVAAVGISEAQARIEQRPCRVYRVSYAEIDRARIDGRTEGFAKLIATPAGKILGAVIVGEEAGLILHSFVLAMAKNLSLSDIARAVPVYPTYAAIVHHLAAQYQATRLERGFVQSALKLLYGFVPRIATGNGTAAAPAEPTGEELHPAASHGHGH